MTSKSRLRLPGILMVSLAALSSLIALGPRDAIIPTAVIFFGVPWVVRLSLVIAGWIMIRPESIQWRMICLMVAGHSMIDGIRSFRWRDEPNVTQHSFEVTLWNAGRNLWKMPGEWPELAGPDCSLVVLIEAGSFPDDTWSRFITVHPDFTWKRLDGGIVVGVKGRLIGCDSLGDKSRFRCHRIRTEISGSKYSVVAVDIPSQPWISRDPYLDVIRNASSDRRCLILGDFNTPPSARGFDKWREDFTLANQVQSHGFLETWCYGMPILQLDQLWLGAGMEALRAEQTRTLRSDHVRMTFRVRPK